MTFFCKVRRVGRIPYWRANGGRVDRFISQRNVVGSKP
jgi:hypothetical protein